MDYPLVNIHTHDMHSDGIFIYSHSLLEAGDLPLGVSCCAAIHPWDVGACDVSVVLQELESLPVVAIGETGLDYAVRDLNKTLQIEVFEAQLQIAQKRRLPVVIHCVKAFNDVVAILKRYDLVLVIFHGFVGNAIQAKVLLDNNWYISLSNRSLSSAKTVDSLRVIPLDRIFVENDASGVDICKIYALLACKLGLEESVLRAQFFKNYNTIFG